VFFYDGANLSDLGVATPWLAQARQSLSSSLLKTLDRLKSITQGYCSFDYDLLDYRESDLV
jgi:hypothetical protein